MSGQLQAAAALTPGKEAPVRTAQSRSGRCKEQKFFLLLQGIEPRSSPHPVDIPT